MTTPTPAPELMCQLADVLLQASFTADGIAAHLGPDATERCTAGSRVWSSTPPGAARSWISSSASSFCAAPLTVKRLRRC